MDNTLAIFKSLADLNRLRIMAALLQEDELCACQLTELLGITGPTVSRHLSLMQSAGLVLARKEGRWIFFKISDSLAFSFPLDWLKKRLLENPALEEDRIRLKRLMSEDKEEICRRQRGGVSPEAES